MEIRLIETRLGRVTSLERRVRKLESITSEFSCWNGFAQQRPLALSKLSPHDQKMLDEVRAHATSTGVELTATEELVWNRWDAALMEAGRELKLPVVLGAIEWEL